MKSALIAIILALTMIGAVSASTCFTVVNSPTSKTLYWKAISYQGISDGIFSSAQWLQKSTTSTATSGLGSGLQHNIRIDKACFGDYLLNNVDSTGIDSGTIYPQRRGDDYFSTATIPNNMYTLSIGTAVPSSTGLVRDISSGTVSGIDYRAIPTSFIDNSKHPKYSQMLPGLCDRNLKITDQMYSITSKVWQALTYSSTPLTCSGYTNIADCALDQGKGGDAEYATIVTLLARQCGIPARVVKGISEGTFDGVNIAFDESQSHYWVEYYDAGWHTFEATESGFMLPKTIETNCVDGIDNDADGKTDCQDEDCAQTLFCGQAPTTTTFANSYSTGLNTLSNYYGVNSLKLGNQYGSVTWQNQALDLRGKNLDTGLQITNNNIAVSGDYMNKGAIATLTNIPYSDPYIVRNGIRCGNCSITNFYSGLITFSIPGIGTYHVANNTKAPPVIVPPTNVTNPLPPLPKNEPAGQVAWLGQLWSQYQKLDIKWQIGIPIAIIGLIWLWRRSRNPYAPR